MLCCVLAHSRALGGTGFILTVAAGEMAFFFSDQNEHVMQASTCKPVGRLKEHPSCSLPGADFCVPQCRCARTHFSAFSASAARSGALFKVQSPQDDVARTCVINLVLVRAISLGP